MKRTGVRLAWMPWIGLVSPRSSTPVGPVGPRPLDVGIEHEELGQAGMARVASGLDGRLQTSSSTVWSNPSRGVKRSGSCTSAWWPCLASSPPTARTTNFRTRVSGWPARALNDRYGLGPAGPLRTVGICLYRDGRDSVAWHGDRIGRRRDGDTLVAIVSLGSRRRFLLRPRGGGPSRRFELGGGDLLVMGGSCQRTWEHSVPKTSRPSDRASASSSARRRTS